jgi:3-dehydroquinate synthase
MLLMQILKQSFSVSFHYNVFFTNNLFSVDNSLLEDFFSNAAQDNSNKKLLFVIDEAVWKAHPYLASAIPDYFTSRTGIPKPVEKIIVVTGGEATKNDDSQLNNILEAINQYGIDRHSFLAVIGGGAVLDMAGYAAAIAHRGIKLIRIPTTVLSQNDSGVGVKNSINFFDKKNFLGTFSPPVAVFNDDAFLRTLDDRNWRSGLAEAIKVALIKDHEFFTWMEANAALLNARNDEAMKESIFVCARLHMEHIAGLDPFETGSSRPLDFGHWSAHKMEQLTAYQLLHGEAVAIGIALDVIYSCLQNYLPEGAMLRVIDLLQKLGFELAHPVLSDEENILRGLAEFREHLGGQLTIMMLHEIGEGFSVHEVDHDKFRESIQKLKSLSKA